MNGNKYCQKCINSHYGSCNGCDYDGVNVPTKFIECTKIPLIQPNINYENTPMETTEPQEDIINKPNHYHKNEIDVNGYLEKHFPKQANVTVAEGFYMGNVIKYVSRHKEKGGLQDLEKAMFNLNKLVELNRQ